MVTSLIIIHCLHKNVKIYIDTFILQDKNEIIPIEVKSSENIHNASLTKFNESNNNKISIRFSTRNLDKSGKIINIPIFMAEYMEKIIEIIN